VGIPLPEVSARLRCLPFRLGWPKSGKATGWLEEKTVTPKECLWYRRALDEQPAPNAATDGASFRIVSVTFR
jgi:hypothetical protein